MLFPLNKNLLNRTSNLFIMTRIFSKTILLISAVSIVCMSFIFLQKDKPVIYLIGDSTVRNNNGEQHGWGAYLQDLFDSTKITVSNQAMAGRSTRTFVKERRWDKVLP